MKKRKRGLVGGNAGDGPVSSHSPWSAPCTPAGRRTHPAILSSLSGRVFQVRQRQIPWPSLAFHLAPWFVFLQAAHLAGNAVGSGRCSTTLVPFSQPKQPRSPSILGANGEIPRLRARKHGTPQSSRPRVRPSTWPNKPSRGHPQSPMENNAAHDYMSKLSRTRISCASRKKTGWLGKIEVTGKGR
ncbi:hypothetical protein LZ31DRAFT_92464 [Colletotrichum somersetense]|nr:hypothetical protein LZ31DRAFT_92464 [Colletotrichum somersetense]